MFQRYAIYSDLNAIAQEFEIKKISETFQGEGNLIPNYNAGVGDVLPIIIAGQNREHTLLEAVWNPEAFHVATGSTSITTETIQKDSMLLKLFQRKRCLIPMNGYFEWKELGQTLQIPFYLRVLNRHLIAVAGLYLEPEQTGREHFVFIPIQVESNEIVQPLSDVMPAILEESHFNKWLDPLTSNGNLLAGAIKPHNTLHMASYRVKLQSADRESNSGDLIQPIV